MTARMNFSDARWFTNYSPVCEIENNVKKELGARNDAEYAELLQKNAKKIFSEQVRIVPKISVNAETVDKNGLVENVPGFSNFT